jgi:hypothetical protein
MSDIVYTDEIEDLIKGIGEKALSLSWLHTRSEKRYSYLNNFLAIPAIILSTITGAGSIGFGSMPEVSYIMGGISIIVSIISTLNSYFSFAKRSEAHRITSVSYNKLYLQVSIELSLPRKKRLNVKEFMKSVSEQIVRLNEIQPAVPDVVITDFKKVFKDYYGTTISIPECCNGLVHIKICDDVCLTTDRKEEASFSLNITSQLEPENVIIVPKEPPKRPAFK